MTHVFYCDISSSKILSSSNVPAWVRQWWAETLEVLSQDFLKQLNEIYNSHTTQFTHLQCTVHGS